MRKHLGTAFTLLVVAGSVVSSAVYVLYRASQHEPEFYQQALRVASTRQEEAGNDLERSVLQLHNNARREGQWQAVFTEEQLNGWLAADLAEKFPSVLPVGVQEPRVAIDPEAIRIACRYDNGKMNTVISFALDIDLTTESNTLAVRVSKVRAGALPVPLKRFFDRITAAAGKAEIALRWSQTEGDPVALVTVPHQHADYAHREIYVETIEVRDGAVFLAGRTEKPARSSSDSVASHAPQDQGENDTVQR